MTRSLDPDWYDPRADTTNRSASRVKREAMAVVTDETCPGTCYWVDVGETRLPGPNGTYGPRKLAQECGACGFERVVAPVDHPHHAEIIGELDRRVNRVPGMLRRFMRVD